MAAGNPKNITSLADLVNPGVKLIVADASVPVGEYANVTVYNIAATWGNQSSPQYVTSGIFLNYPAKFAANVVSYEDTDENIVGDVLQCRRS